MMIPSPHGVLTAQQVTASRRRRPVLHGLDLEFRPGVTAVLGPNGAGKSTLFDTLQGLVPGARGELVWSGDPVPLAAGVGDRARREFHRVLGVMPQDPRFPPRLRVDRFLDSAAWLKGVAPQRREPAVSAALDGVGLAAFGSRPAGALSGGERRRLALATAVVADPQLLLLDEPTAGLDPDQRATFHELLRTGPERTVVVSTHLLEDVVALADRVVVLDQGRVVFAGTLTEFARLGAGADVERIDTEVLVAAWRAAIAGRAEER